MNMLDFLLSSSLFIIMIGIGLSIKLNDFIKELKKPKGLIFGILIQIVFFPLITYFLIKDAPINDIWKVGFLLLAACPSGVLSNLLSTVFKGKPALSIEITALNSLVSLFTLPLYASIAIKHFFGNSVSIILPLSTMIIYLIFVTIVPGIIGALIAKKNKDFARRAHKRIRQVGTILFFVIISIKFVFGGGNTPIAINHIKALIPWVLWINLIAVFFGYAFSFILGFNPKESLTFGAEMGIQNTTFALIVAETILKHPAFGDPALIYSITSLPLTWGILWLLNRHMK